MIKICLADSVLSLTFSDPARKNALGVADYAALAEAMENAAKDPNCRVVVLRGEGDAFSAGNRLDEFKTEWPQPLDGPVVRFFQAIAALPVPVVAQVCGAAVGVGATMLLHCDVVLCSENAFLKLPFLPLGISPEGGATHLLAARVGQFRAFEILATARRVSAQEMADLGLCTSVMPDEALEAATQDWVARLLTLPDSAVRATKELLRRPVDKPRARLIDEIAMINALIEKKAINR